VCECKFFHTLEGSAGFAVMSNKYQFFVVGDSDRSSDEIRVKKLADFPSSELRHMTTSHVITCHIMVIQRPKVQWL